MKLYARASSDTGQVREQNEDSFLVDDRLSLYAVADGMGGHRGGEVASSTSLEALRAAVARGDAILDAMQAANAAVFEAASDDPNLSGMGTTLTAVVALGGSSLLIGHVGDSRAYMVLPSSVEQLTEDHSLVEELVRDGRLTREQADVHPQRAIITRALGVGEDVEIDLYVLEVDAGDRLVLCSDGLTTMLRDRDIARIARSEPDAQAAADKLVDAANEAGGEDNITVLVLDVVEVDADTPPDPELLERMGLPVDLAEGIDDGASHSASASTEPADDARIEVGVHKRPRLRLAFFVIVPVLLVLVVATSALAWYARRTFYVGVDAGEVVVFRGVPGGVLAWQPTVEHRTDIPLAQLSESDAAAVRKGAAEGSRERADSYVDILAAWRGPEQTHRHHHDLHLATSRPVLHLAVECEAHPGAHDHHRVMTPLARRRRLAELGLGMLAVLVTVGGYALVALADGPDLPPDLLAFLGGVLGLYIVAHLAIRRLAPRADGILLPLVALLNGLGFVAISRLDQDLARIQAVWVAVAVAALVGTLLVVRDVSVLERYRYTFALLGILFLLLPLVPGIGSTINGARLWVGIGPINFQPGEVAKVLLVLFFAAYLVEKRELLAEGSRRVGRMHLPDPKHLGPLLLAWGVSVLVMVRLRDLGSSLLFFAVFSLMLYMATERAAYLLGGLLLFGAGAGVAYQIFDHVQVRVTTWLDPWPTAQGTGYQLIQSMFAFGSGGFAGTGLGRGSPDKIPNAATDFIFSAIGEELGLLGTIAIVVGLLLLVGAGFRIAVDSRREFEQLLAAGLSAILGIQAFIILGGVTRLIPLTGLTTPFVSYGGSSLVANFVILGLLLRISDEAEDRRLRDAVRGAADRVTSGAHA